MNQAQVRRSEDEPPAPSSPLGRIRRRLSRDPLLSFAVAGAVVSRIAFWVGTNRQWEDALITLAHARNVADGIGLTHHPGEGPVHGFTSALSVLVPLPAELVHVGFGIVFLRLVSIVAAAVAVVYAYRIARHLRLGTWPTLFALAYLAFGQNQIFYGMAGMETQIAVAILLAGIYYLMRGEDTKLGISLGLAVLVRPDFVLFAAVAVVFLVIRSYRSAIRVVALAGCLAAPWVLFTTVYYGTPIPHTIEAKSVAFTPDRLGDWDSWIATQTSGHVRRAWRSFTPFLEDSLAVQAPLPVDFLRFIAIVVLLLLIIGAWSTRFEPGWWPAIVYVGVFFVYRTLFLPPVYFDWYLPPVMGVVVLLVAAGLHRIHRFAPRAMRAGALTLTALFAIHLPFTIPLEARIQREIEEGTRRPVAEYLRSVVKPGETVSSEWAGYIGYYSKVTLHDFPGLTSPTSLRVMRTLDDSEQGQFASLAIALKPDWLVMRPLELADLRTRSPETAGQYRVVREFKAEDGLSLTHWAYTKQSIDTHFLVLRRST